MGDCGIEALIVKMKQSKYHNMDHFNDTRI